jgi:hypothetical protein
MGGVPWRFFSMEDITKTLKPFSKNHSNIEGMRRGAPFSFFLPISIVISSRGQCHFYKEEKKNRGPH